MRKTRIALIVLFLMALVLEGWAIYDDDWALITHVMRNVPDMVILGVGVLIGHFWWCDCD